MARRTLLTIFLTIGLVIGLTAQEKRLAKANQKYEEYSFVPAIDIYLKVLDKGFENAELLQKLGDSYYFNANYAMAVQMYSCLVDDYPSEAQASPEYYFRYGQSLKSIGDYEKANIMLTRFSELTSEVDAVALKLKSKKDYMEEIDENSDRYDLVDFPYNSKYSDFAPAFYKEGLIFSSDRDTGNLARYRHTWNSHDFLDLYKVNADSISKETEVKLGNVNSRLHESSSATTKDGSTIYFTRNNFKEGKYKRDEQGIIRLKIFRAKWIDGNWGELEELPFNSDSYSVAHPALSPDEKTLYFASDMPGSRGQSDLFKVSINEDDTFGTPQNLGPAINTEARESFPFITESQILYFSSDGHPGLGGLDIFATNIENRNYTKSVLNVGRPVNSSMDDFSFIIDEDSKEGFFASNRKEGMGGDDIYAFRETSPLVFECLQAITGTVRDQISNDVLVGATVMVIDEDNQEVVSAITDSDGKYELSCDCNQGNFVRALTQGYIPAEEFLGPSDGKPRVIDFYLERETITAGYGDDLAKLLQLSTIYFDFDRYKIRPDAEIEIQKVIAAMEKYPSLKIQANSHTDSRGPDAYNLWLSQKRSEATVKYMIANGIAPDRIQGEGYGETRLVNECDDGVRCTAEEHQLNRRSEFIILE